MQLAAILPKNGLKYEVTWLPKAPNCKKKRPEILSKAWEKCRNIPMLRTQFVWHLLFQIDVLRQNLRLGLLAAWKRHIGILDIPLSVRNKKNEVENATEVSGFQEFRAQKNVAEHIPKNV